MAAGVHDHESTSWSAQCSACPKEQPPNTVKLTAAQYQRQQTEAAAVWKEQAAAQARAAREKQARAEAPA
jgi:hypothetical protein